MSDGSELSHEALLDRDGRRHEARWWTARSSTGIIAAAHYMATRAGLDAFRSGGNAFDAAIAASVASNVCEPAGSGIGGMAIALVHHGAADRTFVVEGACRAPALATPEAVREASSRYFGYRAVAVPRNLAVLRRLQRYGSLSTADLLAPAIEMAEAGVPLTRVQHEIECKYLRQLRRGTAAHLFLGEEGRPPPPGAPRCQPVLARTLRRLAEVGFEDFYEGAIARKICDDMRDNGGFIREGDLARDGEVDESAPLWSASIAGEPVCTAGPPAGGLTLLEMLHLIAVLGREEIDPDEPEGVVLVAAVIRQARRDRRRYRLKIAADEVAEAAELLDPEFARGRARKILADLCQRRLAQGRSVEKERGRGEGETSHIVTMDASGNVVSLTQSIERCFGAAVATHDLGFLYNGYLRAFKVQNRRHPHYLAPGAPARSNAAPTLAFRGGKPWAALGNTGSERMASGILEVLLRLRRGQDPFDAVHAPRLHCRPGGRVMWEEARFGAGCREALLRHGFRLRALEPYSFKVGGLQLAVAEDGGNFCGVAEPRRDGAAAGP